MRISTEKGKTLLLSEAYKRAFGDENQQKPCEILGRSEDDSEAEKNGSFSLLTRRACRRLLRSVRS